jgi:hypothetical protein
MKRYGSTLVVLVLAGIVMIASCRRGDNGSPAAGSSPLSVSLSTNIIRVGDVFQATVTAVHPQSDSVASPELSQGKDLIVRNRQEKQRILADGRTETTLKYDLSSLVIGEHSISTGAVQFVHSDGTTTAVPFPSTKFLVQSMLAGPNTPWRDIKGLADWPGAFPRWLTGLLLISALALIAAIVVYHILSKPRTILQYPPPPAPYETALNELRRLLAKGWIESEDSEPFYVELSSIMRRYLEGRFGLRAPELTTEEFIREATNSRSLSSDHKLLTSEFLEQCDLVKFARHRPQRADMQNGYNAAERLVRETIPPSTTTSPSP